MSRMLPFVAASSMHARRSLTAKTGLSQQNAVSLSANYRTFNPVKVYKTRGGKQRQRGSRKHAFQHPSRTLPDHSKHTSQVIRKVKVDRIGVFRRAIRGM
eukprot:4418501-Pleurochrysis_carterae.AAC.5